MNASKRSPGIALAADFFAVALCAAGVASLFINDLSVRIAGIRISLRTPWRPFLLAVLVLAIRNALVRTPPSFAWAAPPLRRFSMARLRKDATDPLPIGDERALFQQSTWRELAALTLGYSALVAALTWPQVARLDSVADLGDPLFSIWRIAWVSHQIVRNPLALFDANQFYPERLTLTYSDSLIAPALMSAPLFWIGVHPVVAYNLLFLSGFALSGATMFLLVRALTGRVAAALISGALFALYPYRYEHYSHLELQMTMWMPLALLALHRTIARGRWRDGLATGLAFALQTLSSLYYGCFFAVYLVVTGGALWLGRGRPRAAIAPLVSGVALAAVLVAPVAVAYIASRPMMGAREAGTIQFYSAKGPDYLKPNFRSVLYGRWSDDGIPERALFPRLTPVALTAIALWPPLSAVRIAYALGLVAAVDGSFGFNGPTFTALHATLSPYQGLRVPARFSLLAGMTLVILAGYGVARLLERWPRQGVLLTAVLGAALSIEALPVMPLEHVWSTTPAIYSSIAEKEPAVVVAEFPMPRDIFGSDLDARYLYFSTSHWQKLVNGNSGFFPPSYMELLEREANFPSEEALSYLRSRGVQYLTMHGKFTNPGRYGYTVGWLDARPDLELVATAPWEGAESRLYKFK